MAQAQHPPVTDARQRDAETFIANASSKHARVHMYIHNVGHSLLVAFVYDFARSRALGIDVQDIHFSKRCILVTIVSASAPDSAVFASVSRLSSLWAVIPCSAPPPPCAAVFPFCSDLTLPRPPYIYIYCSLASPSTAAPAHHYGIRQHTRVFQKRGHCEKPGSSTPPLGECDRLLLRASWPSHRRR